MKTIFYLIVAVAVVFSACQNENSVNPRPTEEIIGKATIIGRVKAELNTTTTGLENVSQGIKIIAEISTADLATNVSGSVVYPNKYYETTVSATGEYSIEVEAGPRGSSVKLYFPDFRADVTTNSAPVSTVFTGSTRTVAVIKNQTKIQDFNY
ncbi:MAG: hypothetical protein DI539_21625 [Flavobacterium psychrophilum]|jgi:hypothetical protein|nr:MAG: hypothetical protein DI539_21625 [Flavobacterium psychrophilum]